MSVRIGFVGAGNMTSAHLEGLAVDSSVRLMGVADPRDGAAPKVCEAFGGRPFTDYRRMFDELELDAVFVCVPPFAHENIELDAAHRGLHLFVEKPVHLDVSRAGEIAATIADAGVISATGYVLRYFPFYDQLRAALADTAVRQIIVRRWHKSIPASAWNRSMAQSGGQILEQLTHQIDTVRALAGEVKSVSATWSHEFRELTDTDIPSKTSVLMELESGAAVVVAAGYDCATDINDMMILTDEALIYVDYELGIRAEPAGAVHFPHHQTVDDAWSYALKTGDLAFIRAIETGDRSVLRTSYSDAVRSLAASVACNLSAAERRVVLVSEVQ